MIDENKINNEIADESEDIFIEQVNLIDAEIEEIERRIITMQANESALHEALKAARTSEHKATSAYAQNPHERTQLALENARDFVTSCKKRVTLFTNNESILSSDVRMLWGQRNEVVAELSKFRTNILRPKLTLEAETLMKSISKQSVRYLALMSLLEGQQVLRLDLTRMILNFNEEHKNDLLAAKKVLDENFATLTKVKM